MVGSARFRSSSVTCGRLGGKRPESVMRRSFWSTFFETKTPLRQKPMGVCSRVIEPLERSAEAQPSICTSARHSMDGGDGPAISAKSLMTAFCGCFRKVD